MEGLTPCAFIIGEDLENEISTSSSPIIETHPIFFLYFHVDAFFDWGDGFVTVKMNLRPWKLSLWPYKMSFAHRNELTTVKSSFYHARVTAVCWPWNFFCVTPVWWHRNFVGVMPMSRPYNDHGIFFVSCPCNGRVMNTKLSPRPWPCHGRAMTAELTPML